MKISALVIACAIGFASTASSALTIDAAAIRATAAVEHVQLPDRRLGWRDYRRRCQFVRLQCRQSFRFTFPQFAVHPITRLLGDPVSAIAAYMIPGQVMLLWGLAWVPERLTVDWRPVPPFRCFVFGAAFVVTIWPAFLALAIAASLVQLFRVKR